MRIGRRRAAALGPERIGSSSRGCCGCRRGSRSVRNAQEEERKEQQSRFSVGADSPFRWPLLLITPGSATAARLGRLHCVGQHRAVDVHARITARRLALRHIGTARTTVAGLLTHWHHGRWQVCALGVARATGILQGTLRFSAQRTKPKDREGMGRKQPQGGGEQTVSPPPPIGSP